jgi:hypothetical protein
MASEPDSANCRGTARPDRPPGGEAFWSEKRLRQWTWLFVALGGAALSLRYLLRFPLFLDEAFLSVNYLDRGPLGLMRPLEYRQVCPLGFLWVQWAVVRLFGFSEYALRLFPFLCGLGSLVAFRCLAGLVLAGTARLLAVGVFSVAYPLVRYASQAKPYSADVLVTVLLLIMAVKWHNNPRRPRWLWAMAASLPALLAISFAPVFVAGAISLSVAAVLCFGGRERGVGRSTPPLGEQPDETGVGLRPTLRLWLAWLAYNLSLAASLGLFFVLSAGAQREASKEFMEWYWGLEGAFPPLAEIARLPGWLLKQHAGDMAGYPIGGRSYGSTLTLVCAVAGLAALLRRRQFFVTSLCLLPLGANFAAACLKAYPYGGHVRVMLYAAPLFCLLAGSGSAVLLSRVPALPNHRHVPVLVTAVLLAILAVAWPARDMVRPYKMEFCREDRDFARWFWTSKSRDAELACLDTDFGLDFRREPIAGMPWSHLSDAADLFDTSSLYRCNRAIYGPEGTPPDLTRVSLERPLRCVHFRSWAFRYDEAALGRWLEEMQSRYRLAGRETHRFPISWLQLDDRFDRVEVYEFVPR